MARSRLKLGELLLNAGIITSSQLNEAVLRQRKTRERLGEALINLGAVREDDLAKTLAQQLAIPYATLENGLLNPSKDTDLSKILTEEVARKYHVLPIAVSGNFLTIAAVDPLDLLLLDNVRKITGTSLSLVIATRSDLNQAIDNYYGRHDYLKEAVTESYQAAMNLTEQEESVPADEQTSNLDDLIAKAGEATVVKLVDLLMREAINSHASDIHIEPSHRRISIRYRIDGILQEIEPPTATLLPAILSRIKIMARLDIAEKRLPQDGGFSVRLSDRTVDVRVSSVPTIYGEKIVMRLLDKSSIVFDFEPLGLTGKTLEHLKQAMVTPYGLIFLTGPTGSGKTTTLYTILNKINSRTKNIMTIEDPVEYKIVGINQVQAKPQIGLNFAAGLRSFLRQDPDIIMVGEVRDLETAEICVRAALTGHLVLSTLHTNDAPSAITRLIDIGIEPYLLSPSLIMVIAQRLVRRLCNECKEPYAPPASLQAQLPAVAQYKTLYRAKGCDFCRKSGYSGRVGIYEGLYATNTIQELIAQRSSLNKIKDAAREAGMKTLLEDGIEKAAAGLTSVEEVVSVTAIRGD